MATIISVANQKGGSGKTTTAINVVCGLAAAQYKVAALDLDPQASITKWNMRRTKAGLEPYEVKPVSAGLLEDEVTVMRNSSKFDVVVVDCPGNMVDLTTRAVELSDAVLSPVKATYFDFEATKDLARFIKSIRNQYPDIRFMLFLNEKHAARNLDKSARENLIRIFQSNENTRVLETEIPDAAAVAEFGGTGQSMFEYAPKSPAARLYKKLTKEVVECLAEASVSA